MLAALLVLLSVLEKSYVNTGTPHVILPHCWTGRGTTVKLNTTAVLALVAWLLYSLAPALAFLAHMISSAPK